MTVALWISISLLVFIVVAGAVYWIGEVAIPRYLRGRRRLDRRSREDE